MKPFKAQFLPINSINLQKLIFLVSEASKQLSLYNGILQVIPNPNILLAPMTTKEAVLSSQIEGTQVSFNEMLEYESENNLNIHNQDNIQEVINYKNAINEAENLFLERPFIYLNMIKRLHSVLLSGVRGNNKARGEFRKAQVYIGNIDCKMEDAKFIPPEWQDVLPLLDNWEKYINNNEQEVLIQCAIMHAQFEIIHPFLDGNGRLGRILIPLFLYQKEYITKPVFYLSEYFEKNKLEYYSKLNNITSHNNWDGWIEFFLNAIIQQSKINISKSKEIINLYNDMKTKFVKQTHSEYAINILDNLFKKPIISSTELAKNAGINNSKTYNTVFKKLVSSEILTIKKQGKGSRPTIYSFNDLINIIDK